MFVNKNIYFGFYRILSFSGITLFIVQNIMESMASLTEIAKLLKVGTYSVKFCGTLKMVVWYFEEGVVL